MAFNHHGYNLNQYLETPWYDTEINAFKDIISKLPNKGDSYVGTQHTHGMLTTTVGTPAITANGLTGMINVPSLTPSSYVGTDSSGNLISMPSGSGVTGPQGATGPSSGFTGAAGLDAITAGHIPCMGYSGIYTDTPLTSNGTDIIDVPNGTKILFDTGYSDQEYITDSSDHLALKGNIGLKFLNLNGGGVGAMLRIGTDSIVHDGPIESDGNYVDIPNGVRHSGILVDTSLGVTGISIDTVTYSGISWRPSTSADASLTVTLTGAEEGSIFNCFINNYCSYPLVVEGWVFGGSGNPVAGTLMYDYSGWMLLGTPQ